MKAIPEDIYLGGTVQGLGGTIVGNGETVEITGNVNIDDNATNGVGLQLTGGGNGLTMLKLSKDVGSSGPIFEVHANGNNITATFVSISNTFSIGTTTTGVFRLSDHPNLGGSNLRMEVSTGGNFNFQAGKIETTGVIKAGGYTVATLPAGIQGDMAFVTDATTPTYLGTLTGGGAVVTPVFYNGTVWVSH